MSALEQEIMEKIQQLEPAAKQRILQFLQAEEQKHDKPSNAQIWERIDSRREQMRAAFGPDAITGVQGLLDELREEASHLRRC
jgi:hypothetical protein